MRLGLQFNHRLKLAIIGISGIDHSALIADPLTFVSPLLIGLEQIRERYQLLLLPAQSTKQPMVFVLEISAAHRAPRAFQTPGDYALNVIEMFAV